MKGLGFSFDADADLYVREQKVINPKKEEKQDNPKSQEKTTQSEETFDEQNGYVTSGQNPEEENI